jgi:probable rRNA maturation factor
MSAAEELRGAEVELDLAFSLGDGLAPELRAAAGALASDEGGEESWSLLLGRWLAELAAAIPAPLRSPAYSLGLQLCDDPTIAGLNEAWRGQAGPTDVLAFAAQEEAVPLPGGPLELEPGALGPLELGDIVISLETAARQAREHDHPLDRELRFLASHGLLHLLGWDHPDEESLAAMLELQDRLLGLPVGWG